MKINLQNYESYFVRYIDNDLSKTEVEEVQRFLQQHPELNNDLDAFRSTVLQPDDTFVFPAKAMLKRSVHAGNYEDYFARYVEQDLSAEETAEVNIFLQQNPSFTRQLDAYKATRLVADTTIVFPDKKALKKEQPRKVIPMYARYILSAAVAAGLLLLFFVKGIQRMPGSSDVQVAQNETVDPAVVPSVDSDLTENNSPDALATLPGSTGQPAVSTPSNSSQSKVETVKKSVIPSADQEIKYAAIASVMEPMEVGMPGALPENRRTSKAPYLVPVYEEVAAPQQTAANSNNNTVGGWLSIASVVGTEILKLSGRGDLVKASSDVAEQPKKKEPVTLSIQTRKFSFYHKFLNKNNASTKN